jgi:hypothetical protein
MMSEMMENVKMRESTCWRVVKGGKAREFICGAIHCCVDVRQ